MSAQGPQSAEATQPVPQSDAKRNRLGRGLAALIGDAVDDDGAPLQAPGPSNTLPLDSIRANPHNPRRRFADDELDELARSIREKGLLQPLVVRPVAGLPDTYEIVAGERRWRAAQRAQLHDVPAIIKAVSDAEALEIAIIENVQRSDLNPIEEAAGYKRLMDEFSYTQEEMSRVIGKSRSHVANTLRLMNLPDKVKGYLTDGLLSAGHARALLSMDSPERLATEVVQKGLSVRQTEAMAKQPDDGGETSSAASPRAEKDADTRALEKDLAEALGLRVEVNHRGGRGDVRIRYTTLEQLDSVCRRLMSGPAAS